MSLLTAQNLPKTESEFFETLRLYFPNVYDVKYLMKSCKNLKGGLQEVANELEVPRIGPQHQAGSDSLLTGQTFFKMKEMFFEDDIDDSKYCGHLYGLGTNFVVANTSATTSTSMTTSTAASTVATSTTSFSSSTVTSAMTVATTITTSSSTSSMATSEKDGDGSAVEGEGNDSAKAGDAGEASSGSKAEPPVATEAAEESTGGEGNTVGNNELAAGESHSASL